MAWPERTISPVSRSPVEKDSDGFAWVQDNAAVCQMLHGAVAGRDRNMPSGVPVRLAKNHLIDRDIRRSCSFRNSLAKMRRVEQVRTRTGRPTGSATQSVRYTKTMAKPVRDSASSTADFIPLRLQINAASAAFTANRAAATIVVNNPTRESISSIEITLWLSNHKNLNLISVRLNSCSRRKHFTANAIAARLRVRRVCHWPDFPFEYAKRGSRDSAPVPRSSSAATGSTR